MFLRERCDRLRDTYNRRDSSTGDAVPRLPSNLLAALAAEVDMALSKKYGLRPSVSEIDRRLPSGGAPFRADSTGEFRSDIDCRWLDCGLCAGERSVSALRRNEDGEDPDAACDALSESLVSSMSKDFDLAMYSVGSCSTRRTTFEESRYGSAGVG